MESFKKLRAYQVAFAQAERILELSRKFPKEELYSLTSQIRRSSRSVCANLAEGYRKRQYPAHFISKVSDADAENSETSVWLDFAEGILDTSADEINATRALNAEVGRLLGHMLRNPENYLDRAP